MKESQNTQSTTETATEHVEKERRHYTRRRGFKMNFELASDRIETLRKVLKVLDSEFDCDELAIRIGREELIIRFMDPSRYKMVNFVISKVEFEEWRFPSTKVKTAKFPVTVAVRMDDLLYAIGDVRKDTNVRFEIDAVWATVVKTRTEKKKQVKYKETTLEKDDLRITVRGTTVETYDLKLLDYTPEEEPMPKVSHHAKFKLIAPDFRAKIERVQKKADHCELIATPDRLIIKGRGETVKATIRIEKGGEILLDIECKHLHEEKVTLSIEQLLSILPPKKVAELITLELATDMPVKTKWFTNFRESTLEFYLAPRIDVE